MKFTKQAIVRGVLLAVAVLNMFLVMLGQDKIEICEETVYQIVSGVFLVCTAVRAYWKNNSASLGAKIGDKFKTIINGGDLSFLSQAQELLDNYYSIYRNTDAREGESNGTDNDGDEDDESEQDK